MIFGTVVAILTTHTREHIWYVRVRKMFRPLRHVAWNKMCCGNAAFTVVNTWQTILLIGWAIPLVRSALSFYTLIVRKIFAYDFYAMYTKYNV